MRKYPILWAMAALALGWGGHRVFQRVEGLRHRASAGPPAPVGSDDRRQFAWVPPGRYELGDADSGATSRTVVLRGFWMARTEVMCEAFAAFLNETRDESFQSPQFVREGGAWQPIRPAVAATHVSLAQARAFTQWYSARHGCRARLPSTDEWEAAARGGIAGAPFSWGWGGPADRADFATNKVSRTALYPANGFGLFDLSGGVAEWCEPDPDGPEDRAPALGGSWSDRDAAALQPGRRTLLPVAYRDADVGFRLLVEPPRQQ